jgi:hypothetical protein
MGDPRGGVRHVIPEKGNYLAESRPEKKGAGKKGKRVSGLFSR